MAAIADAVISRWFTPPFAQDFPEKVAAVRKRFLEMDPRGYAVCCRVIRDMDLRQDIGLITAPTLVIAGADDPATPVAMMEDIRERIADSELVVLPRAAHLLAIEQAEPRQPASARLPWQRNSGLAIHACKQSTHPFLSEYGHAKARRRN